jgi:hypothetical protein
MAQVASSRPACTCEWTSAALRGHDLNLFPDQYSQFLFRLQQSVFTVKSVYLIFFPPRRLRDIRRYSNTNKNILR